MTLYLLFSPLLLPLSLSLTAAEKGAWREEVPELLKGAAAALLALPLFVLIGAIIPAISGHFTFLLHYLMTRSLLPPLIALALFLLAARLFRRDPDDSLHLYAFMGGFFFVFAMSELVRVDSYLEPTLLFLLPSYRLIFILYAPQLVRLLFGNSPLPYWLLWTLAALSLVLPAISAWLYERSYSLVAILLCGLLSLCIIAISIIDARR